MQYCLDYYCDRKDHAVRTTTIRITQWNITHHCMKSVTVDVKPTDTSYKNHCAKNPGTGTGCVTTNHLSDWRDSRLAAKLNIAQADLTTGVSKRSQPTEPPMIYNVSSILRKHEHRTLAESNHDASFADESDSGVLIRPVAIYPDPFRNRNSQLVLCEHLTE